MPKRAQNIEEWVVVEPESAIERLKLLNLAGKVTVLNGVVEPESAIERLKR